jgi:hypothetical protein
VGTDNSTGGDSSAPRRLGSVADVQKVEEAYAQSLEQAYGKLPSFVNPSGIDAGIESSIKQSINAYAQQQYQQLLSSDLDTQAAPNFSGHNYSSYTATQLKQMVGTNMDPTSAGDSASAWNEIGNDYVGVAQDLSHAVSGSESGWEGAAGDATRGFIGGVSQWAGSAGQGAQLAGNRLAVQSEAASTAKNSMPTEPTEPPSAADVSSAMLQGGLNPAIGAAKLNAQFAQAAADHAEAVQAARVYDSSLATSGEKFPAFNAPPTFDTGSGAGGNMASSGGSGVAGFGAAGNAPKGVGTGPMARTGAGRGSSSGSAGAGASHAVTTPPTAGSGGDGPSSSTGLAGFDPGSTGGPGSGGNAGGPGGIGSGVPGGASPGGGNGPGNGAGSGLGNGPGNGLGSGPGNGLGNEPSLGGGWNSGGSPDPTFSGNLDGDGEVGGGARGFGAGGGGGSTGGVGRGVGSGTGQPGARSGAGAGVAGEEELEGGAGTRGTGTGGTGMMAPRGSGKRGEDAEHKRPAYLLNPDPDETFGSDERVVPPVIE